MDYFYPCPKSSYFMVFQMLCIFWCIVLSDIVKKVVRENLELVFPDKSKQELNTIEKGFYHHMCDMFLEMVKTMALSKEAVQKKIQCCQYRCNQ